jgi:hypothetical protein
MRKLPLEGYAFPALAAWGIGEKNTVSNGPDNGSLNCNAKHLWNSMRHGSTQQAIDNGLSRLMFSVTPALPSELTVEGALGAGGLNIGAHGNDGQFETGSGQTGPFNTNQFVYLYNEDVWGPQLDRIKPSSTTIITIYSCHTGTGQDGADLLFEMAKRSGRAVRACTGFLFCGDPNGIYMENGAVWQVATPTNKPAPIAAPSPHFSVDANVKFESTDREYDASDVVDIEFWLQSFGEKIGLNKRLSGQTAQYVAANLFYPPAMVISGRVSAMITGHIRVSLAGSGVIDFAVFNDRLAVDVKSRTSYYIKSIRSLYHSLV